MTPKRIIDATDEDSRRGMMASAHHLPLLTSDDLARKVPHLDFLIRGIWPLGSHGPIAGRKKAMKSYVVLAIAIAVASGLPLLGNEEWKVPEALPVVIFAGEGGVHLIQRRLQRIARDVYGIKSIARLPLIVLPATPKFGTTEFAGYLLRAIETLGEPPGLVIIDSVYNYHPSSRQVQVSNVYDRGPMLADVSHFVYTWCGQESVVMFVDHFRATGDGRLDLDSISQAGMAEFADTWMLLQYRAEPDPDNGIFPLRAEIGSRQDWPGAGYEMDWDIGRFDTDLGEWTGQIAVESRSCARAEMMPRKRNASDADIRAEVGELVREHPWLLTKDQVVEKVTGGANRIRTIMSNMAAEGELTFDERKRKEGGRMVKREVWAIGDGKQHLK